MKYHTIEGKTYCVVGTVEGTVTSASGVVIASFSANEQNYFTAPAGGFVTISDETAIVTPVFKLAPSALVGESGGGDTPTPSGDYSDFVGYIEYDDETGAIVDMSIPKYTFGNLSFKNEVLPDELRDWKIDMPYLTNGKEMFDSCNLTSFSGDLSSLTNGYQMFRQCSNLTECNTNLPNLTNGVNMFNGCSKLASFSGDLPKMTDGRYMFQRCINLTSFEGDLSALTNGYQMFQYCNNLTSFSGDLSSLANGEYMFDGCKLDAASVERILSTIPTYTDGSTHKLSLNFSSEAAAKFEEITGVSVTSWETVSYKGWTIGATING